MEELTSLLDRLTALPNDVHLNKGLEADVFENEAAEVVVGLDQVPQEYHDALAQLEVKLCLMHNLHDMLVDNREELGAQKARPVVAGRNLRVLKELAV